MNLRLAIAAALAGSAIGAAVVLADDRPAPKVPTVAPAKAAPRDRRPPVHARDITIEARAQDPGGGPPWAVRRFTATGPAAECSELGRIVGGVFGWIDGYGTFHPARAGRHETPDLCLPAESIRRIGAQPIATTTVTYPRDRSPLPSRGIVWGLAAPDIRTIRAEGSPELDVTKRGAFLAVGEQPAQLTGKGEMVRRDGSIRRYDYGPGYPSSVVGPSGARPVSPSRRRTPPAACRGPSSLPRPHGGTVPSQPGRLLGARLGVIERPLDTFEPAFGELFCRHVPRPPTPAYPLRLDAGIWSRGSATSRAGASSGACSGAARRSAVRPTPTSSR